MRRAITRKQVAIGAVSIVSLAGAGYAYYRTFPKFDVQYRLHINSRTSPSPIYLYEYDPKFVEVFPENCKEVSGTLDELRQQIENVRRSAESACGSLSCDSYDAKDVKKDYDIFPTLKNKNWEIPPRWARLNARITRRDFPWFKTFTEIDLHWTRLDLQDLYPSPRLPFCQAFAPPIENPFTPAEIEEMKVKREAAKRRIENMEGEALHKIQRMENSDSKESKKSEASK